MPERDAGMEGRGPGYTERNPFYDAKVISVYTSSQAVADGIKIQLGQRLWCTTNFARTVASKWFVRKGTEIIAGPFASSGEAMHYVHNLQPQSVAWATTHEDLSIEADIDRDLLHQIISGIVSEYVSGSYAVPKRADQYGEADAELASYLVEPGRGLVDEAAPASEQEVKVWAIGDPEGLHILLPEDY
jgi:hypothetical protein